MARLAKNSSGVSESRHEDLVAETQSKGPNRRGLRRPQQQPALWQYLQTAAARGIRDGYLVGKRSPWYKQEHRAPAPFLCT
jgi:hypothetical protein